MSNKKLGEYMKTFHFRREHVSLSLFDTGQVEGGKYRIGYRMRWHGETLFESTDFMCSPCYAIDSRECALSLLGFLTLQKGDVESEYFSEYTERQIEWRESDDCQSLGLIVCEWGL